MELTITTEQLWAGLVGIVGLLLSLYQLDKIMADRRAAKAAPDKAQDARIAALEAWRVEVDRKLADDLQRLDQMTESTQITHRALWALLSHALDGNNRGPLQRSATELQEHLLRK